MAGFVWWSVVAGFVAISAWALSADYFLYKTRGVLITDYLRAHPWSFWWSALGAGVSIVVLALHLFITATNGNHNHLP